MMCAGTFKTLIYNFSHLIFHLLLPHPPLFFIFSLCLKVFPFFSFFLFIFLFFPAIYFTAQFYPHSHVQADTEDHVFMVLNIY